MHKVVRCTMSQRWYGYLGWWCFGQLLQMLAVHYADEPVVAAFSNMAVVFNAWLAHSMQGERVTGFDGVAIAVMVFGACLVVIMCPEGEQSLSFDETAQLFARSPLPSVGLVVTGVVAVLAVPRALHSFFVAASDRGPSGGVAWGVLAGYSGATSMTCIKVCFLWLNWYGSSVMVNPVAWPLAVVAAVGEVGMAIFVFCGMQRHEASVVVPAYYISMTLFASVQGLCLFLDPTGPGLGASQAAGFTAGVLLCTVAVGVMAGRRSQRQRTSSSSLRVDRSNLLDRSFLTGTETDWQGRVSSPLVLGPSGGPPAVSMSGLPPEVLSGLPPPEVPSGLPPPDAGTPPFEPPSAAALGAAPMAASATVASTSSSTTSAM